MLNYSNNRTILKLYGIYYEISPQKNCNILHHCQCFLRMLFPYNRANIRCKLDVLLFVTIFLKAMIHYHIHDKSLNSAEKYNLLPTS